MDILLVKETGDAAFINGTIPTTDETRQSVGQRLKIKLQTFYGTWFMDETYGIPYIEQVMGRKRSKSAIDALIQAAILEEPLVKSLVSYTSEINSSRQYLATFQVMVDTGEITEPITINTGI